jgi:hypothetical protein
MQPAVALWVLGPGVHEQTREQQQISFLQENGFFFDGSAFHYVAAYFLEDHCMGAGPNVQFGTVLERYEHVDRDVSRR